MSKITTGNIPANVTYICRPNEAISFTWDGDDKPSNLLEGRTVRPAYVSDTSNKKTLETGARWAKPWVAYGQPEVEIFQASYDNVPLKSVEIISLEKRSQGGRAYKVIVTTEDNEQFWVDLREDVLLVAARTAGISKGGFLNGQFIWARVGSDMKLVQVGSELHERMVKTTVAGKKPKITKYEVGGIYETKTGVKWVFCGLVDTVSAVDTTNYYGYGNRQNSASLTHHKGVGLWIKADRNFDNTMAWYKDMPRRFEFAEKKAVVSKVDQVTLPDDFYAQIRAAAAVDAEKGRLMDDRSFCWIPLNCGVANMKSVDDPNPVVPSHLYQKFFALYK